MSRGRRDGRSRRQQRRRPSGLKDLRRGKTSSIHVVQFSFFLYWFVVIWLDLIQGIGYFCSVDIVEEMAYVQIRLYTSILCVTI